MATIGPLPILLVSHGFQPNYEKAFANGLARNGLSVAVVTSDRSLVAEFDSRIEVIALRGSQEPNRSRLNKAKRLIAYVFSLYGMILARRFQAIHLIGIFITASVPLGWVEVLGYRLLSKRLLLTVHNLLPHDRHTWLNRTMLKRIYMMPDTLVVHTRKMRTSLIEEWGIPADRVVQMEHGVDDLPVAFNLDRSDDGGALRLLIFGSVLRYKGVDIALEALCDFRDFPVSVLIVGQCRDECLAEELTVLISRVPSMHQVEWRRGFVPEKDVQGFFESSDAVLLPYRHIDQSGVLLTAYRFGKPVLAFDVGSFSEYVNSETGVLVTDRTSTGLQYGFRQIRKLLPRLQRDAILNFARRYLWVETVRVLASRY